MSTSLLSKLMVCGLLGSAAGVSAAESLLEAGAPDMARTRERLSTSLYGQAWNQPAVKPLREFVEAHAGALAFEAGVNPLALLKQAAGLEIAVADLDKRKGPKAQIQLRGEGAVNMINALLERQGIPEWQAGARIGRQVKDGKLLLGVNSDSLGVLPPASSDADVFLQWNREAIVKRLLTLPPPSEVPIAKLMASLIPQGSAALRFTDRGLQQELRLSSEPVGLQAIDRDVVRRLPGDVLAFTVVGVNGKSWWAEHGDEVLAAAAVGLHAESADQVKQQIDGMLQGFGLQGGLGGLFNDLAGSFSVIVGQAQGTLIPAITIGLPRSASMDQLVTIGCGMIQQRIPEQGQFAFLILDALPMLFGQKVGLGGVVLGRDAKNWWISTDSLFVEELLSGKDGAWASSEFGKEVLARTDAKTSVLGSSDSRGLMRALIPIASIAASQSSDKAVIEASSIFAHSLAKAAGRDITIGGPTDGAWSLRTEGPLAGLVNIGGGQAAIIAAIAIPNLLESKKTANRNATVATLKSAIFAGQVSFQAGAYSDVDQDNIGEYGFLSQLAGGADPFGAGQGKHVLKAGNANSLTLLGQQFKEADKKPIYGYYFKTYISDGKNGALDYAQAKALADKGDQGSWNGAERYFITYAWPEDPSLPSYCITQSGRVYQGFLSKDQMPPAWNAAMDGKTGPASDLFRNLSWEQARRRR